MPKSPRRSGNETAFSVSHDDLDTATRELSAAKESVSAADKGREQSSETERRERGRLETARKQLAELESGDARQKRTIRKQKIEDLRLKNSNRRSEVERVKAQASGVRDLATAAQRLRAELTAKSREIAATATLLQQAQAQNRKNEAVSRRVSELTGGAYGEVSIAPTLATENIEAAGNKRDLSRLSAGTLDQLATVLRLTIAEKLGSTVVLDDQLVQSDASRMNWLYAFMRECAKEFQILVLTCHPTSMIPRMAAQRTRSTSPNTLSARVYGNPTPCSYARDPVHVAITGFDATHVAIGDRVQLHLPKQADESGTVCLVYIEGGRRHAARLDSS